METRSVYVVNYHDYIGNARKAEYFCQNEQVARRMFRNTYKASAGYKIISILDWRVDLRNKK